MTQKAHGKQGACESSVSILSPLLSFLFFISGASVSMYVKTSEMKWDFFVFLRLISVVTLVTVETYSSVDVLPH